jgi:hypothetical protein
MEDYGQGLCGGLEIRPENKGPLVSPMAVDGNLILSSRNRIELDFTRVESIFVVILGDTPICEGE